jgi:hypothetical protein
VAIGEAAEAATGVEEAAATGVEEAVTAAAEAIGKRPAIHPKL